MKNESLVKLSEENRNDIIKAMASKAVDALVKTTQLATDSDAGTFNVIVSTADRDRQNEIVKQDGWDLAFYKLNPVVLWAHDYSSLPVGVCTSIGVENNQLVATGKFAPLAANPYAQQVRMLYELGFLKAVSVGFIPKEFDPNDHDVVTKAEMLEFSFVPVPANAYALSTNQVKDLGLDLTMLKTKGLEFEIVEKSVVPYADHGKADEGASWSASKERKECGDDMKKLKAISTWYDQSAPDKKGSYKLPHHEADGLKAVWRGVSAAMGALLGARGGTNIPSEDKKGCYNHLAKHYKAFGKDVPDYEKAVEFVENWNAGKGIDHKAIDLILSFKEGAVGDTCELDDGTPGILARDPKNPSGPMVCIPSKSMAHKMAVEEAMDNMDDCVECYKGEHEDSHKTHQVNHMKAVDTLRNAVKDCMKGMTDEKAAGSVKEAFDAHESAVSAENGRHKADVEENQKCVGTAIEDLMKCVSAAMKDMPNGPGTGDDVGGNPTADQVRMVKTIKDAYEKLSAVCTALKAYAEAEGGGNDDDLDDKAIAAEKVESSKANSGASDVDSFIRNRELLKILNIASGKMLQKFNEAEKAGK